MTVSLKHTFQSAKTDSLDVTLVQPSNWNEEHELELATNKLLGRATAGTGAAEEIGIGAALSISGGTLAVTNVPVANGGTGASTLTGYVKGNGTSAFTAAASVPVGDLSGTLPVASGGTGATTLTANSVLVGNGTSAVTAVAPSTSGNVLTSNGTSWTSATPTSGPVVEYARQFCTQSTANFTIPAGVTSIKLYACGKGGDSISTTSVNTGGGGGGGFGFGTLAVTAGQVINVTIGGGVATVARSAVTLITANVGGSITDLITGGVGGTATINAVLTSGAAYTGGAGGPNAGAGAGGPGGGGSAGSPLGNGFVGGSGGGSESGGGGGGIGGVGGSAAGGGGGGGGGAGGAGSNFGTGGGGGGGAGGAASGSTPGAGRVIPFSDPLLADLTSVGAIGGFTFGLPSSGGGPGSGGAGASNGGNGNFTAGGFGGGGGGRATNSANGIQTGGALGGGGGAGVTSPGSLAGGGAGGGRFSNTAGGPATVWIFY